MNTSTVDTILNTPSSKGFIVDTTLRDGEQTPGLVLSLEEKSILLSRLIDIGITEFEIGIPAMGDMAMAEIKVLQKLGHLRGARMICWARCHIKDVEACASINAAAIHISLPVSDIQMKIIGRNRTEVLDQLNTVLSAARSEFDFVSVGAQDSTRADRQFLMQYIDTAFQMGAQRVRVSDTVGCASPIEICSMIRELKSDFPSSEIEFHAHNDFGMATANALAAIQSGADAVSTTVLGIGERAGNAALESVVVSAKEILGYDLGVDTRSLYPICRYFSRAADIPIAPNHPIVGDNVFTHESGIHTHGQLRNPKAFQPIAAEEVGREQPDFVFGVHSGKSAVKALLEREGREDFVVPIDLVAKRVTQQIKKIARQNRSPVSNREIIALAKRQFTERPAG